MIFTADLAAKLKTLIMKDFFITLGYSLMAVSMIFIYFLSPVLYFLIASVAVVALCHFMYGFLYMDYVRLLVKKIKPIIEKMIPMQIHQTLIQK